MKSAILVLGLIAMALAGVYQQRYDQALKIARGMNLEQKIGQVLQVDFGALGHDHITDENIAINLKLGSLLIGGNGMPGADGNLVDLPGKDDEERKIYYTATIDKWYKLAQKFNYTITITTSDNKKYDIRPLLGTDAVHGNQHVSGTILFPHNSGLACSHNPDNFFNAGKWTAEGVKKSGFNYAFAPTVAVSHNPQWGRFYETMGQEADEIYKYAKSYTEGIQGKPGNFTGILGSVKHFYADGATMYGADEGNSLVGSFKSFIYHNTQGYNGSIEASIGSVMVSYSAINWIPNAIGAQIGTILRQKLKFDGFVISDYDEMQRVMDQGLPTNFNIMKSPCDSVTTMLNAGMDMFMLPGWRGMQAVYDVIDGLKNAYNNKTITEDRLNDAVARIIAVKLVLGAANLATSDNLSEEPIQPEERILKLNEAEYQDSLTAVQESLVLLKNTNNVIPFSSSVKYVVLVGEVSQKINGQGINQLFKSYDNIGMQNGGWTLRWQGFLGNSQWQGDNLASTNASSILGGLKSVNPNLELIYPQYTSSTDAGIIDHERSAYLSHLKQIRKDMTAANTVILSVLGEMPFAEMAGDVGIPYCLNRSTFDRGCLYSSYLNSYVPDNQRETLELNYQTFDQQVISNIREKDSNIPIATVLLSGRPMLINNFVDESNAIISAWLPGTSGGHGIANALTGKYRFRPKGVTDKRNTLAFDWPRTHESMKGFPYYQASGEVPRLENPLFQVGHGLATSSAVPLMKQLGEE